MSILANYKRKEQLKPKVEEEKLRIYSVSPEKSGSPAVVPVQVLGVLFCVLTLNAYNDSVSKTLLVSPFHRHDPEAQGH